MNVRRGLSSRLSSGWWTAGTSARCPGPPRSSLSSKTSSRHRVTLDGFLDLVASTTVIVFLRCHRCLVLIRTGWSLFDRHMLSLRVKHGKSRQIGAKETGGSSFAMICLDWIASLAPTRVVVNQFAPGSRQRSQVLGACGSGRLLPNPLTGARAPIWRSARQGWLVAWAICQSPPPLSRSDNDLDRPSPRRGLRGRVHRLTAREHFWLLMIRSIS